MKIEPFGVEQWMNRWETRCELNLAETCVHSLTVAGLMRLAGRTQTVPAELAEMRLTYGAIPGSLRLRTLVAGLHAEQTADNVLIAHGTIGANMLVYQALVEPGDRVVSVVPTYQQHTAIPRALGAEVCELPLRPEAGWQPDLDRLAEMVTPGTRLIAMVNPNNPTGAMLPPEALERIVRIARTAGAWVLCDEVYRGTAQTGDGSSPSIADIYEMGIATGSMSKVFSLAGLRLGWLVGPPALLREAELHRDYSTISVGMIDEYFATLALENAAAILERSRGITRGNAALLAEWVAGEPRADWVPPQGGTTALLRLGPDMPSQDLCRRLIHETGVLLTPGGVMGAEGWVRVGFGNDPDALREGLERLSDWLRTA